MSNEKWVAESEANENIQPLVSPWCCRVAKESGVPVATGYGKTAAEAIVRAAVIAAAPDLFAALIYMRRTMYSDTSEESIIADAAIAKALAATLRTPAEK